MANKIKKTNILDDFLTNILDDFLTNEQFDQIDNMVKEFKKDKSFELEVSFKGINYPDYMRIIEYYVDLVDEDKINSSDYLDISINLSNGNTYRISMFDTSEIENFLKKYAKSTISDIQKYILGLNANDNIEIMFKDRGTANRLYIEDLNTVFKLTKESPLLNKSEKPKLNGTEKILYRYKQRNSFLINENVRIDMSEVKESNNLWNLSTRRPNYEIEMEVVNHKINTSVLFSEVVSGLQIIQKTSIPIGKSESRSVIETYKQLLEIKKANHLDARNVISIEAYHIINYIPNKYAVTDKADGERFFLFVIKDGVYLLSINLSVKKINLEITDTKFHNMLLDGELIENENGYFFMAFDVVYFNHIDYRHSDKYTLIHRLEVLNHIIDKCFGMLIPFVDYTVKHTDLELNKIKSYYSNELKHYWSLFREKMKKNNNELFITRKIYFVPYGIDSSEIFLYANMLWKLLVYDKLTPYKLDGTIYTPINSPYMIKINPENLDAQPLEYKWKIPSQNSIDFFIKFELDANGQEIIFYDNTVVRGEGNAYKICTLYSGTNTSGQEKPVPFKINGKEQVANIYLIDGEARDIKGRVIDNETVVEFIFDTSKQDINDAYKWIPLKTRYDKTESVQKYHKRYGNNINIATRIWRTIINPITEETILSLANPATYQKEMDRLTKLSNVYDKQSFTYYQKKTSDATGMRAFNNWIKSNMILTYCQNKHNVLDIGAGRGGDLIKFIHAKVEEYVGLDIDNNGLYIINDSAYNRYKNLKHSNKNVPPMYFIHADARGLLNVQSQENIIPNMTTINKKLIETHLSGNKKYDIINAQFTLHYYLSDELSWSNFCQNINDHLQDNGYMLITTFDGQLIYDRLIGKSKMTVSYTDNHGNKNIFFEILKIYNDSDITNEKNKLGISIDLYNSLISRPGTYIREYLVFSDFLEKSLKENCSLELIETDSFFNLFNLYKNYFTQQNLDHFAQADTSNKRHNEIRDFYFSLDPNANTLFTVEQTDIALASFKLSMLNRYYIFKKTTKIDLTEPSRIVGINNKINLGKVLVPYFDTNMMAIDSNNKTNEINNIYHMVRRKHIHIKPSIYLIRHTITKNNLDNKIYQKNKLEFFKVKKGSDPKTLLIYKSPDKYFYPIYYQPNNYDNDNLYTQNRTIQTNKVIYLLDSKKIVKDLDILVALTNKLYTKHS